MEKQLRAPENWQDFETLCKKLWGEIWECPDIRKHGKIGQAQNGVDLYGIPKIEKSSPDIKKYHGIQCKKKDKLTNAKITIKEIDESIEEAKSFNPPLKVYYIATVASRDAVIEEHVRVRNIENMSNNLFEIQIYFWEDITELIDDNKRTHDWYVKLQNYHSRHKATLFFHNDNTEITLEPRFRKTITHYKVKVQTQEEQLFESLFGKAFLETANKLSLRDRLFSIDYTPGFKIPHSFAVCRFAFKIHNLGSDVIEDYKIYISIEGKYKKLDVCTKGSILKGTHNLHYKYDAFFDDRTKEITLIPHNKVLVPDECIEFDKLYMIPELNEDADKISLQWKLISRNYQESGSLGILIRPEIIETQKTVFIDDPQNEHTEVVIEEYTELRDWY